MWWCRYQHQVTRYCTVQVKRVICDGYTGNGIRNARMATKNYSIHTVCLKCILKLLHTALLRAWPRFRHLVQSWHYTICYVFFDDHPFIERVPHRFLFSSHDDDLLYWYTTERGDALLWNSKRGGGKKDAGCVTWTEMMMLLQVQVQ